MIDFDSFDDFEERGLRVGGGKRKNKAPTESQIAAKKTERTAILEARRKEAEAKIEKHIGNRWGNLPDEKREEKLKVYLKWIKSSLIEGFPIVDQGDIFRKTKLSSGPGGQHHQKNETAVVLTHSPTLISAKSENERSQPANIAIANKVLIERLNEHFKLWQETSEQFKSRYFSSASASSLVL